MPLVDWWIRIPLIMKLHGRIPLYPVKLSSDSLTFDTRLQGQAFRESVPVRVFHIPGSFNCVGLVCFDVKLEISVVGIRFLLTDFPIIYQFGVVCYCEVDD